MLLTVGVDSLQGSAGRNGARQTNGPAGHARPVSRAEMIHIKVVQRFMFRSNLPWEAALLDPGRASPGQQVLANRS